MAAFTSRMQSRSVLKPLIRLALREDAAFRDLTSRAILPARTRIRARIVAKAPGVLAGGFLAVMTFLVVDRSLRLTLKRREGARLLRGRTILTVEGRARSILAAERTALNFLGHLSGIATHTRTYVRRIRGTRAKIFDTRKTLPGLRRLEKFAVYLGGGHNHRGTLAEAVLIKTTHLRTLRRTGLSRAAAIHEAIRRARRHAPGRWLEVEAASLADVRAALAVRPDAILLDNLTVRAVREAIRLRGRRSRILLEVSGGITLTNVRAYAKTGVDRISVGRLTHSAPALDISLESVV
ncbi:MAG: nicotinate-nucleotide pyrophosphorylase (carboxylating) [Limisphaerales bacterium]|nr:MAG: nicotinate-nucleotide pyrophosphorylase (carboxylating) [Limisphaerales bacterium]